MERDFISVVRYIQYADDTGAIETLIKFPHYMNKTLERGETLLHIAALNGREKVVDFLIRQQVISMNAIDISGFTPLHEAARGKNLEVVKMLLDAGADVNRRTSSAKRTALDIARQYSTQEICDFLQGYDRKFQEQMQAVESLRKAYEEAEKERLEKIRQAEEERRTPKWQQRDDTSITRITEKPEAKSRLTEIFNFTDRMYILKTTNTDTKVEAVTFRMFDEFNDLSLVDRAAEEFKRQGGAIASDVVTKRKYLDIRKG